MRPLVTPTPQERLRTRSKQRSNSTREALHLRQASRSFCSSRSKRPHQQPGHCSSKQCKFCLLRQKKKNCKVPDGTQPLGHFFFWRGGVSGKRDRLFFLVRCLNLCVDNRGTFFSSFFCVHKCGRRATCFRTLALAASLPFFFTFLSPLSLPRAWLRFPLEFLERG